MQHNVFMFQKVAGHEKLGVWLLDNNHSHHGMALEHYIFPYAKEVKPTIKPIESHTDFILMRWDRYFLSHPMENCKLCKLEANLLVVETS